MRTCSQPRISQPSWQKCRIYELNLKRIAHRAAVIAGESQPWDKGTLQLLKTIHIEKTG
jgi:hypothetical protein